MKSRERINAMRATANVLKRLPKANAEDRWVYDLQVADLIISALIIAKPDITQAETVSVIQTAFFKVYM